MVEFDRQWLLLTNNSDMYTSEPVSISASPLSILSLILNKFYCAVLSDQLLRLSKSLPFLSSLSSSKDESSSAFDLLSDLYYFSAVENLRGFIPFELQSSKPTYSSSSSSISSKLTSILSCLYLFFCLDFFGFQSGDASKSTASSSSSLPLRNPADRRSLSS